MNELVASPILSGSPSPIQLDGAENGNQQIEEVATEFEGVFLSLLVKEMRATTGEDGLFGNESTDSFGGLFDMYLGQHLAKSKPLGIASLWVQQYEQNSP